MHSYYDKWAERIMERDFHGGDEPDYADFVMYSHLQRVSHMPMMLKITQARSLKDKALNWYQRMDRVCKGERYY